MSDLPATGGEIETPVVVDPPAIIEKVDLPTEDNPYAHLGLSNEEYQK